MAMEKFRDKYILFLIIFFFSSCMSNKEKILSDAYVEFNYQIDDLRLDIKNFNGSIRLVKDDRNFFQRKNHVLYGWNSKINEKKVWIYLEVDTTFIKEPSVSYSNNFFEITNK